MNPSKNSAIKLFIIISLYFAAAANIYFYISKYNPPSTPANTTRAQTALIKIGEKCLYFGERAVAKDVPIIEFQQLEREAKRTNVIQRCMTDSGYQQNPAWLGYAQAVAKIDAEKEKMSFDEALTHLSRKHLQVFTPVAGRLDYWVKKY
jgi:hypothetical protein